MKIREEIMLFILKKYNRWKIRLLEVYGCLKNMTIGKKKKINKGLNFLLNGKSIVFEKWATQIEKYNTLNPSSSKRSTIWA